MPILCLKCPKIRVPKAKSAQIFELALTALFLSAYISKIVFFGNSRIFVKILYIGVKIFYGFVGQWIP